jgi:hypothetical protein
MILKPPNAAMKKHTSRSTTLKHTLIHYILCISPVWITLKLMAVYKILITAHKLSKKIETHKHKPVIFNINKP